MRLPIATVALATVLLLGTSAHGEQRHAARLSIETAETSDLALSIASSVVAPHDDGRSAALRSASRPASAGAASAGGGSAVEAPGAEQTADAEADARSAPNGFTSLLSGIADQLMGISYQFGGNTETGVDCSGLVRLVWQKLGLGLASLPRTAASMATLGLPVSLSDIKPGDLVFFNTLGRNFSHVGVYLGEGRFLHASSGQRRVTLSSLSERYFRERFEGARRLLKQ